jgi:hypothetical protein
MEFDHTKVRLGKAPYVHDDRTLMMAKFILPDIHIPEAWDFDQGRAAFPNHMWGNDEYGDCVIAMQANQELRLERIETNHTIKLDDSDAINRYKRITGCVTAGDENDTGLEMIAANRDWRGVGFAQTKYQRNYLIDAYGELDPGDHAMHRAASYLLHGTGWGFWLPDAAKQMTRDGLWDYHGQTGAEWKPGSWGGHAVYSKKFDPESISVLSWEMEIQVTNAFIDHYADEAWAVVDSLDQWRRTQALDVPALEKQLAQITSKINE